MAFRYSSTKTFSASMEPTLRSLLQIAGRSQAQSISGRRGVLLQGIHTGTDGGHGDLGCKERRAHGNTERNSPCKWTSLSSVAFKREVVVWIHGTVLPRNRHLKRASFHCKWHAGRLCPELHSSVQERRVHRQDTFSPVCLVCTCTRSRETVKSEHEAMTGHQNAIASRQCEADHLKDAAT